MRVAGRYSVGVDGVAQAPITVVKSARLKMMEVEMDPSCILGTGFAWVGEERKGKVIPGWYLFLVSDISDASSVVNQALRG